MQTHSSNCTGVVVGSPVEVYLPGTDSPIVVTRPNGSCLPDTDNLEIKHEEETALDERQYREKRKAAQAAMKQISTMFTNPEKPKRQLLGKQFKVGDTIRIHRPATKSQIYQQMEKSV